MNIHEWAERLQTTVAGFARMAGISRATANSWRADKRKSYAATPRPQTLLDMAASLEVHGAEACQVAQELREAAGEPEEGKPGTYRLGFKVDPSGDLTSTVLSPSTGAGKRRKKPATEV